ncbi:hypothetical protein PybrP1_008094 [[Pythium] brassicae (nom. inval.)]|nr:hypothetical protein PybrP1_008094 [[Pythium] brassicae (nom. inval.)]
MKLATIFFAVASAAVAVSAQTPSPAGTVVAAGGDSTPAPAPAPTTATTGGSSTTPAATPAAAGGAGGASGGASGGAGGAGASTASGEDRLAMYKASPTTDAYHMAPVRVVHARVQSDSPILVEGQLVSSFGGGKLDAGYLSGLDSVNTASVEGALMYVQAETINIDTRDKSERCVRKTKVQQVVFYEILIAQTNETLAHEENIEFSYNKDTKTLKASLPFWNDPLNTTANSERTQKMLDAYKVVLTKGSTQVDPKVSTAFRALPTPTELAKMNPPCYKSVKLCGSGSGCKRTGYSQLCTPCSAAEKCPTSDGTFKFPTLAKAFTTLSVEETTGNATAANNNNSTSSSGGKNGTSSDKKDSAASHASVAFATIAASLILSLAL